MMLTCDAREKLGRDTPFFREMSEAAADDPFRFRLLFAGLEASRTRVLRKKNDCLMNLTRRGHHLLPFLKQSSFQTVSWIEGISFMSRH